MKKGAGVIVLVISLLILFFLLLLPPKKRPLGSRDIVWNASIAKDIAYDVAWPIYGKINILSQMPFKVAESNDVWLIRGRMHLKTAGGVVVVHIAKNDGRVMLLTHGK